MNDVFVIGAFTTPFARLPEVSFQTLATQAVEGVRTDAGLTSLEHLASVHFGNCAMHAFGQTNIRGQVALTPMLRSGALPANTPIINVEGGCATGSLALHGAFLAVASGAPLALAVGVEKTFVPDAAKLMAIFDGGIDQLASSEWKEHFARHATACGTVFEPSPARILMLDVCALQALWHMKTYGTTKEQLAFGASKNHAHGAKNPNAQYRKDMSVAEVLADKPVLGPFTRAMCAPISDGAAATLLCSAEHLRTLPEATRKRAVKLRTVTLAGGRVRGAEEESVNTVAARRAYAASGVTAKDVNVAEVHDATSFAEIAAVEALGFVKPGEGGAYVASGATALGGARPVNTSGGLVSKGHPLGATGLAMVHEVTLQLRGEAGARQVAGASVGIAENAGGLITFDEALCAVSVLTRS